MLSLTVPYHTHLSLPSPPSFSIPYAEVIRRRVIQDRAVDWSVGAFAVAATALAAVGVLSLLKGRK